MRLPLAYLRHSAILWCGIIGHVALAQAQNLAPALSNLAVTLDTAQRSATITFDLNDAEADPMDVWLRVSGDQGRTWRIPVDSLSGDVGYPIGSGSGKSITWHYDLNALSTLLGSGPATLTFRVSADDRQPVDIAALLQGIDSTRMMGRLAYLEGIRHRSAGPVHHQDVLDSLKAIRDGLGLQSWDYPFTSLGFPGTNLIGRKYGLVDDGPTWYITGHYDSEINTPGVDDNASATIAVMEAMEVLAQQPFEESIRFIGFDLEEDGLLGSFNYVNNRVEAWESVEGVLNMEMIGFYSQAPNSQTVPFGFNLLFPAAYAQVQADSFRGNFLTNVSNTDSEWLMHAFDSCASMYVPGLRVIHLSTPGTGLATPDLRRSDHASFWDQGHPALMLTDGANLRNPNYHQPGDSLGTIHPGFYLSSARAVIATLIKLAKPLHAGSALSAGVAIDLPVGVPVLLSSHIRLYPNPTEGRCKLELNLPAAGRLKVGVRDMQGRIVATLHDGPAAAGLKTLEWDGRQHASGTYFVEVDLEGRQQVLKLALER